MTSKCRIRDDAVLWNIAERTGDDESVRARLH
jgi:hypothetical protein